MKAVVQRVSRAQVSVNGEVIGKCGRGFLILLGVMAGDDEKEADKLVSKIVHLRIFEDENGKMNLSSLDVNGSMLVVSQFTLCADCSHGRRPSFTDSAPSQEANTLYEYFVRRLSENGIADVQTGSFGADMQVELVNDGPVTIILNSADFK
ncbi:MAG TPA: D-tyrosyl-tRNA(Tyr) deacylase [Candidatus Eubacterium faecavium]|nr:D-tyrosyl-tRNA(Tyr) deacylase [Candidatus Eubacterium faecavium]